MPHMSAPVIGKLYPCLPMNPFKIFILGTFKRATNLGNSEDRAFWVTELQLTFLILMVIWPACLYLLLFLGRSTAIIILASISIFVIHPLAKRFTLSVVSNNKEMLYTKRIVVFSDSIYVIVGLIMLLQMWLFLVP